MECPRKYFYRYILGWTDRYPSNHLVFGKAWHLAMEHLLRNNYSIDSLAEASEIFLTAYREELDETTDENYKPKTPMNANRALIGYFNRFRRDDPKFYEVLHTETGGTVLIGEDAPMVFRMDCIRKNREDGTIEFLDHKSSKVRLNSWGDLQKMTVQMHVYYHALCCMVEFARVAGGRVRSTFFRTQKENEFEEVRIVKTPEQLQAFLSNLLVWYDALRRDMYLLSEMNIDDSTMTAFPQNPNGCYSYGRICPYIDICPNWTNPVRHTEERPVHLKVERWDPLSDPRLRDIVDLTESDKDE
jgi:hypothetical protein